MWSIPTDPVCTDDYGALEPSIDGRIMELHHKMHHNTYVNSYNNFSEQLASAESKGDIAAQIALQPLINFHGGGHLNHSLFWENLAPKSAGGGEPPSGKLEEAIRTSYGSMDDFKSKFNTALAGIQGSGWAWLVKEKDTGNVMIKTYAVSVGNEWRDATANSGLRTKIPSSVNSSLYLVLMLGSMPTSKFALSSLLCAPILTMLVYNIRTAKQNTSRLFGMSSTGRLSRRDSRNEYVSLRPPRRKRNWTPKAGRRRILIQLPRSCD